VENLNTTKGFREFERKDIWREGKWLDLWSVVHFCSGISLAFGLYFLHFGSAASLSLAFVLLVAYEMWEVIVKIDEAPTNRLMYVVVGLTSFVPTYFLILPRTLPSLFVPAFIGVLCINGVLSVMGWRASQKAAAFEARMRERYLFERARFLERRARHKKLRRKK